MSGKTIQFVQEVFAHADIRVGGDRPWDIQVHDPGFYSRIVRDGSLGLGESYMDAWWDAQHLDQFIYRILTGELRKHVPRSFKALRLLVAEKYFNRQSKSRAVVVSDAHYNLGNDLFQVMLDERMVYTCGYWKDATTLAEAQVAKMDLVCRKLGFEKGMHVLDIGCGWGSFAKFAAERYGVSVVGIGNAVEQIELGSEMCKGLPVELRFEDYRDTKGSYDRVVSIGMFEAVGPKNFRKYMEVVDRCLKKDGLFLLHTIGANRLNTDPDAWTDKYIFPNGYLPTIAEIAKSIEGLFVMEDWHNFAAYYEKTLLAWHANFERGWPALKEKYGERFYRMWTYYLLSFAGSFRARSNQLWQIVMSKKGVPGGYVSLR
ncbi:MAG TPA: cyclopropane fatty acyl phospholipid synthase [Rhodothermales bacterium]|nr:cyclopropane fatty acyl phospholipid synthase [Rhodothermales bacterium]